MLFILSFGLQNFLHPRLWFSNISPVFSSGHHLSVSNGLFSRSSLYEKPLGGLVVVPIIMFQHTFFPLSNQKVSSDHSTITTLSYCQFSVSSMPFQLTRICDSFFLIMLLCAELLQQHFISTERHNSEKSQIRRADRENQRKKLNKMRIYRFSPLVSLAARFSLKLLSANVNDLHKDGRHIGTSSKSQTKYSVLLPCTGDVIWSQSLHNC